MLKWTVINKRNPADDGAPSRRSAVGVCTSQRLDAAPDSAKSKRRRSSASHRRSSFTFASSDKENRYTSTPIKPSSNPISAANPSTDMKALRDVSNLTPNGKETHRNPGSAKKSCRRRYSQEHVLNEGTQRKKKKRCLDPTHPHEEPKSPPDKEISRFSSDYFRPFESVDSHIEGIPDVVASCRCGREQQPPELPKLRIPATYTAPTLPTFALAPNIEPSCMIFRSSSPPNPQTTQANRNFLTSRVPPLQTLQSLHSAGKINLDDLCPPNKKARIDHVDDFLQQISYITSPEDDRIRFTATRLGTLNGDRGGCFDTKVTVSPLVRRFVDLRFSRISFGPKPAAGDGPEEPGGASPDDTSTDINDMSLDKIVEAILESDDEIEEKQLQDNTSSVENASVLVNLDCESRIQENEENNTHENNLINLERERRSYAESLSDRNSNDSGFRSTTTEQSDLQNCRCTNFDDFDLCLNECDRTIINLSTHVNERCVDIEVPTRKRSLSPVEYKCVNDADKSEDADFTLKRQKCVRRRRNCFPNENDTIQSAKMPLADENASEAVASADKQPLRNTPYKTSTPTRSPMASDCFNDNSFESSRISVEENGMNIIRNHLLTPNAASEVRKSLNLKECPSDPPSMIRPLNESLACAGRRFRRCLSFSSTSSEEKMPTSPGMSSAPVSPQIAASVGHRRDGVGFGGNAFEPLVSGSMDLSVNYRSGIVIVNVIRCRDLCRTGGRNINAYVKVTLHGTGSWKCRGGVQRTAVQADSTRPQFHHRFAIPVSKMDLNKRLQLEVWHRDRNTRRSEFLGCMSFAVKHAIKKEISGSFKLLPQSTGRNQNLPITYTPIADPAVRTMGDQSQSSVEEVMSVDDLESESRKTSTKSNLNQQQKDADENIFLRYLELDPTEGPDAIPAALQRKASGNKNGRTPFTITKLLTRPAKTGFGFSVVWTHPPRIERVEKGLPADRAGILPGDYLIFVDKHNVVMMPEIDILNLIKSYGNTLTLEIYRRNPARNGSLPSVSVRHAAAANGAQTPSVASGRGLPPSAPPLHQHRSSTVCSTNTASVDYSRRRLHLPQVTFSSEKQSTTPEDARKKAMYQLIVKEQQYATGLQFAVTRFVSALAERLDLISPTDHLLLFQNMEEILRITEDILDNLVQDDGEPNIQLLPKAYHAKCSDITSGYRRYFSGIKKADCILANKTKNSNSEFVRFLQVPAIPRRRPDITSFIHKPLEHYREVLRLLNTILSNTKSNHEDYPVISQVVHDLQLTYREITAEGGLMEPVGEGRPLLSVQDLENRLVFTKCKPFVLSKPGRQWIFGGDLSRVEGRNVRQYWTLLFSDLLLFAKVSRDRVLFITEEPLPLAHVRDVFFNVRKKATEFRITVDSGGKAAESPTAHCGPDLTRTPKRNATRRCVVLRAPSTELKAVWQNLLQRQIFQVNAGIDGSSFSSPIDSPDAPITSSAVTLQSAESLSLRRQTPHLVNHARTEKQIDEIIESKCKQLGKCSSSSKGNAFHLEQWMKGELGNSRSATPDLEAETTEVWTEEMVRKRSEELQLIDSQGNLKCTAEQCKRSESRCEELILSDDTERSPSRSTTTESQVTVRSSPLLPETVQVCKQCHKTCLTNSGAHTANQTNNNVIATKCSEKHHFNDNAAASKNDSPSLHVRDCSEKASNHHHHHHQPEGNNNKSDEYDDWGPLMLIGLSAINPAASLVQLDPFTPTNVPKIAVVPPTPDLNTRSAQFNNYNEFSSVKSFSQDADETPDDSPLTEDLPYQSLCGSNPALRRFGTVSSLERLGSSEDTDDLDRNKDRNSSSEEESTTNEEDTLKNSENRSWAARAGSFVSEKMAFFERLGEDYRTGGGFFERYLRTTEIRVNGEDLHDEECETSGGTSGEEIWGTPTSGGELDDPLTFPNSEDNLSGNGDSASLTGDDDTELMMDELLMTPTITGPTMRGLLPRRRLEPLIEEDLSDSSTSSTTKSSPTPEEDNGTGDAADNGSTGAVEGRRAEETEVMSSSTALPTNSTNVKLPRCESYRHIVEDAEDVAEDDISFFSRFRQIHKFKSIERINKGARILEFFTVRRGERRVHETFPSNRRLIKVFSKEGSFSDDVPTSYNSTTNKLSPSRMKDKQLDRRFWKQLSRRRNRSPHLPA